MRKKEDWKPTGKEEWQVFLFSMGGLLLSVFLLIAAFTQFVIAFIMAFIYQNLYEASKFIIGTGLTLFIGLCIVLYTKYKLDCWANEYLSRPAKEKGKE